MNLDLFFSPFTGEKVGLEFNFSQSNEFKRSGFGFKLETADSPLKVKSKSIKKSKSRKSRSSKKSRISRKKVALSKKMDQVSACSTKLSQSSTNSLSGSEGSTKPIKNYSDFKDYFSLKSKGQLSSHPQVFSSTLFSLPAKEKLEDFHSLMSENFFVNGESTGQLNKLDFVLRKLKKSKNGNLSSSGYLASLGGTLNSFDNLRHLF